MSKGTAGELRAQHYLTDQGWCCGSRRHIPGPADLLAVHRHHRMRLAEVKATKRPYECFGPADRAALKALADELDADAFLIWTPTPSKLVLIPSDSWPR